MKNKRCDWCDDQFESKLSYQKYCSVSCRELATKEKIVQRYIQTRASRRIGKERLCKICKGHLSIYNDDNICSLCNVNPEDVKKALNEIKRLANEE